MIFGSIEIFGDVIDCVEMAHSRVSQILTKHAHCIGKVRAGAQHHIHDAANSPW